MKVKNNWQYDMDWMEKSLSGSGLVYTENCNCHKQGARLRHSGKINKVDNGRKSRNENALILLLNWYSGDTFSRLELYLAILIPLPVALPHPHTRHECRGLLVANRHVKNLFFYTIQGAFLFYIRATAPRQPFIFGTESPVSATQFPDTESRRRNIIPV